LRLKLLGAAREELQTIQRYLTWRQQKRDYPVPG
jgi:hypothetical protein